MLRRRHRPLLFWLVAVALLWRGLIPAGFMPVSGGTEGGLRLALCSGGTLVLDDAATGAGVAMHECVYAATAAPALPMPSFTAPRLAVRGDAPASGAAAPAFAQANVRPPPVRGPPLAI